MYVPTQWFRLWGVLSNIVGVIIEKSYLFVKDTIKQNVLQEEEKHD